MVVIAYGNAHRCLFRSVVAERGSGFKADLFEFAVPKIPIQTIRRRIIGHVHIGPSCAVEVRPEKTEPVVSIWIVYASLLRNVGESAVAVVVIERIASALQAARTALHIHSAVLAIRCAAKLRQVVEVKI